MTSLSGQIIFRDVKVAQDVGKMAELGYFDVEFTMYGCVYLKDGRRRYKISPNAVDIYNFIEKSNLQGIYPGNVIHFTHKCPVPSGMKEIIADDIKMELAKKLREEFSIEFLQKLQQLAQAAQGDSAYQYLAARAEELEGQFDDEALLMYQRLIEYSFNYRLLSQEHYAELMAWLAEERENMSEDTISKDIKEKTFYGLAYWDNDSIKYVVNAQKEFISDKRQQLQKEGKDVSVIYSKTYWFNYTTTISKVRKDFERDMNLHLSSEFMELLRTLTAARRLQQPQLCHELFMDLKATCNETEAETLKRYAFCWGVE